MLRKQPDIMLDGTVHANPKFSTVEIERDLAAKEAEKAAQFLAEEKSAKPAIGSSNSISKQKVDF